MRLLLLLLVTASVYAQIPTAADLYAAVSASYKKSMPASFTADIAGDIIDKQVGTIPKSQTTGKGKAKLTLYVKQGFKPKLVLTGVSSFYETMFSRFVPHLMFLGPFAIVEQRDYKGFLARFAIASVDAAADMWRVKVRDLKEDAGFAYLFIDKTNSLIMRGEYWFEKKLIMRSALTYTNNGQWNIIDSIDFSGEGEKPYSSSVHMSRHTAAVIKDDFFK